jgi:non-ribosomal peptide synthase protein (TIGR01720 family)
MKSADANEAPLTPIQQWFFDANFADPQHFNQSLLIDLTPDMRRDLVEQTVHELIAHHDALRLRFVQTSAGWRQSAAAPDGAGCCLWRTVDLSTVLSAGREEALSVLRGQMESSLNLAAGPLVAAAWIDYGMERAPQLFLTVHHLGIDAVSWRILLDDLRHSYASLVSGQTPTNLPLTSSFVAWAQAVADYAAGYTPQQEIPFWTDARRAQIALLPRDMAVGDNRVGSAQNVEAALGADTTARLLKWGGGDKRVGVSELLVAALALTLRDWSRQRHLLMDVEGHGRHMTLDGIDLAQTVGWFTTIYPLLLDLPPGDDVVQALTHVQDQMAATPAHGFNYGVLRYGGKSVDVRAQLAAMPAAEVSFNYLGQWDALGHGRGPFAIQINGSELSRSPRNLRGHLLEVSVIVVGGQLRTQWIYSAQLHRRATIAQLAADFLARVQRLVDGDRRMAGAGLTPSDFPQAGLNQQQLERILAAIARTGS